VSSFASLSEGRSSRGYAIRPDQNDNRRGVIEDLVAIVAVASTDAA
jgi:hypothetical protein